MAKTAKKTIQKKSQLKSFKIMAKEKFKKVKERQRDFMSRRPHRSLKLTKRRDYVRSLKLPGYWSFTMYVLKTIKKNKKIFIFLALAYSAITVLLIGLGSKDTYDTVLSAIDTTNKEAFGGGFGAFSQAGAVFITLFTGGVGAPLTEGQQIYTSLLVLLSWLTTVWLLRNLLAGQKVKLRDGLYNASSPLLSTAMVGLLIIVQLLPVAVATIAYSAAVSTGLLSGGVEAMIFWIAAGLLTTLSMYWLTTTFMALVIVTLPGMYPMRAVRVAGDLVVGRRFRILLRLLWLIVGVIVTWAVIMIPLIMFDTWVKTMTTNFDWLPTVAVAILLMSSATVIWCASYIYLLYRKVMDDDAKPVQG